MEDFGYSRKEEESAASSLIKRAFLIGATLFSVACFIYVTINAYYYFSQDGNTNIETIKASVDVIKVVETASNSDGEEGIKIDNSIYEDIFGNRKHARDKDVKIRESASPALPPKNDEEEKIVSSNKSVAASKDKSDQIIVYSDSAPEKDHNILLEDPKSRKDVKNNPQAMQNQAVNSNAKSRDKKHIRVQIAALTSKKSAEEYWDRLQNGNSGLLSGLKGFVEQVDLGKRGIFYRLQIGNFFDQVRAEEFCNRYVVQTRKSKADCIVVE